GAAVSVGEPHDRATQTLPGCWRYESASAISAGGRSVWPLCAQPAYVRDSVNGPVDSLNCDTPVAVSSDTVSVRFAISATARRTRSGGSFVPGSYVTRTNRSLGRSTCTHCPSTWKSTVFPSRSTTSETFSTGYCCR